MIGHEIGHGFDDSGSTFDGDGVMRNWWTEEDRAEFEKRTEQLIEQYNGFQPFDDLSVNGEFTLGENIGDLGGITIGLLAYQMSLNGEEPPVIDGFTGIQRVFLGYAQVWRNIYRDESLRLLIGTDPHAPGDVSREWRRPKCARVLRSFRRNTGGCALSRTGGARQDLVGPSL